MMVGESEGLSLYLSTICRQGDIPSKALVSRDFIKSRDRPSERQSGWEFMKICL
jgi:hypothetical protein